jgi:hypothetical protein
MASRRSKAKTRACLVHEAQIASALHQFFGFIDVRQDINGRTISSEIIDPVSALSENRRAFGVALQRFPGLADKIRIHEMVVPIQYQHPFTTGIFCQRFSVVSHPSYIALGAPILKAGISGPASSQVFLPSVEASSDTITSREGKFCSNALAIVRSIYCS